MAEKVVYYRVSIHASGGDFHFSETLIDQRGKQRRAQPPYTRTVQGLSAATKRVTDLAEGHIPVKEWDVSWRTAEQNSQGLDSTERSARDAAGTITLLKAADKATTKKSASIKTAILERAAENAFQNKDIHLANALYDRLSADLTDGVQLDEAKKLGDLIMVDWEKIDPEQLRKGIEVEMEHADVTKLEPIVTAQIAHAHLKEDPSYYKKLEKVEG